MTTESLPSPPADRPAHARRVLMIAFYFPPMAGSSGVQRTLRFVQHLPDCGWQPSVLTVHPRVYEATSSDLLREVPSQVPVVRAFALDAARDLALFGRYPGALARPDRWRSWRWWAVRAGLRMIDQWRPDVIWSTYPIATAHLVAADLNARTGIPWVADFRDPMAQEGYPSDPAVWQSFAEIERLAASRCAALVFVTPSAVRMYRERFAGGREDDRFVLIENGYDEDSFAGLEPAPAPPAGRRVRMTLLHSGVVYPSERDPTALFAALGRLLRSGRLGDEQLTLRFRAPVHDATVRRLAQESGCAALVDILPPIPYREALAEMLQADALLVMQGANCNQQVPAKLYEYLRAGRPILGLADPCGDTAAALRAAGLSSIARLEDSGEIESVLVDFIAAVEQGRADLPSPAAVRGAGRRARAAQLASLFEGVASGRFAGRGC